MKKFVVEGKVWRWPGISGWHFVYVGKDLTEKIKKIGKVYGSGFIKINASIGKSSWDTALFPHKKEETFLISIKQSIRKKEGVFEGNLVRVKVILI